MTMRPVWTSGQWWLLAVLLWVGSCAAYFLTAPGRIDMYDGGIRFQVVTSILDAGDTAVRNPYYFGVPGIDGWEYAFYQLGAPVTAVPFAMIGRWLGGGSVETTQFAYSMTTVPFAAAVVALLFMIYGRIGCSTGTALTWALVAGFCTLLWPYAGSTFDAILQAFWLLVAIWGAVEAFEASSYRWATVSGAAFAMLLNIQETYVVLVAALFAAAPLSYASVAKRARSPVLWVICLGALVGMAVVFGYNAMRFGNPLDTGRTAVAHPLVGNTLIGLAGLTVSPAKSMFLYSPPLVLALVGLWRLAVAAPHRFAPLLGCLVIHLGLVATLKFWAGEWAWGPRYMVASLPVALVGLPFAARITGRAPLVWAVCGIGLAVQLLGIAVDHQRYYVERAFGPYFWIDESTMYTDSPLLARPREIVDVMVRPNLEQTRAFVPGPLPLSMTSSIFGPPPEIVPYSEDWMRRYLVFQVPRPWPLWSAVLPERDRPGPTPVLTAAGAAVAATSFIVLAIVVRRERLRPA